MEDDLPMICWFKYIPQMDVVVGSYFTIEEQYVPKNLDASTEFEIVNILIPGMQDAIITQLYKFAPRRVKA
jgi:hypothetical protein